MLTQFLTSKLVKTPSIIKIRKLIKLLDSTTSIKCLKIDGNHMFTKVSHRAMRNPRIADTACFEPFGTHPSIYRSAAEIAMPEKPSFLGIS